MKALVYTLRLLPSLRLGLYLSLTVCLLAPVEGETDEKCLAQSPGDICDIEVRYGELLKCDQQISDASRVAEQPELQSNGAEDGEYLVIMFDPDAPIENYGFLHWMAEATVTGRDIHISKTIVEYTPPAPPSGVHRYQLFLCSLPANDDVSYNDRKFNLCDFIKDKQLEIVASTQFKFARE